MRRFAAVLAVSIVLFGAGWARAAITTVSVQAGDYVIMSAGSCQYVANGETGGEFQMTVFAADGKTQLGSFFTFCADPTTFMDYGTMYHVDAVSDANALGYELSDYGKWIFYEYAKNETGIPTASYIPGHTTTTSNPIVAGGAVFNDDVAGAIQEGIWGQLTKNGVVDWPPGWNQDVYNTVSGAENWVGNYQNGNNADFEASQSGIGIAQMTLDSVGVQNQMVFTMLGSGIVAVPEPASLIVWSLLGAASWLGVGVWRGGRRIARRSWSPENRQAILEIINRSRSY